MKCPCHSSKEYEHCCAPYHRGESPPTALLLMRSRYSAYALGLINYLIATTHPGHPEAHQPLSQRIEQITHFCQNTRFVDLHILEFIETSDLATVTFHAQLFQGKSDISFTEKSEFVRVQGRWLYLRPLAISH